MTGAAGTEGAAQVAKGPGEDLTAVVAAGVGATGALGVAVEVVVAPGEVVAKKQTVTFDLCCEKVLGKEMTKMKKNILILLCFGIFIALPNLVFAECGSIAGFDRFSIQDDGSIILYAGTIPAARFSVNCSVQPSSRILALKTDVCDGDDILIDDMRCAMMDLKIMGP